MRRDLHGQWNRTRVRGISLAGALAATMVMLACFACNGFFVDPKLQSIQLIPAGATILAGATRQFQAVGTYDDGNTRSVSSVVWSSSAGNIATISGSGMAKGIATGSATITATSGGVSGTTTLTVQ